MRFTLALFLLLGACKGISEKEFVAEWESLFCEGYVVCATEEMLLTVGQRECLQYLSGKDYPNPPECRYDRKLAEQCIDELTRSGCDGVDPEIPEVCASVYSECPFPRVPAAGSPTSEE